ncbi:uncharacterized protein [Arachis hypogaea]|uniref:uncharacterized protein n=1 Tax=Arachis hypogaea TaxID=3818 RepID=UPI003B222D24
MNNAITPPLFSSSPSLCSSRRPTNRRYSSPPHRLYASREARLCDRRRRPCSRRRPGRLCLASISSSSLSLPLRSHSVSHETRTSLLTCPPSRHLRLTARPSPPLGRLFCSAVLSSPDRRTEQIIGTGRKVRSDDSTGSISSHPLQPPFLPPSPSPDDCTPGDDPASIVMPPPSTRSSKVRNSPPYLLDYHCFSTILHQHEPKSFRVASTNSNWQQAMQEEIQAPEKAHTWDLVDPLSNKEVVESRWVYKIKTHSDGSIDRYKARLVA